jgi:hypothetical protein
MSVVLLGMEMPDGCENCLLRYRSQGMYCTDHCCATVVHKNINLWTLGRARKGDKPDWCPLRPLPEKHGRLIDADELEDVFYRFNHSQSAGYVQDMETIVEAEGE